MVAHWVPIRRDTALQCANGLQGSPAPVAQSVPYGFDIIRSPDRLNLGSLEKISGGHPKQFCLWTYMQFNGGSGCCAAEDHGIRQTNMGLMAIGYSISTVLLIQGYDILYSVAS